MRRTKHQQSGISLIEVLISLVVLSVGLLGIAGMQATGMRYNHAAYAKMQATNMAMDIADRIRSNKVAANVYAYDSADTDHDVNKNSFTPAATCTSTGCSASDLAKADLYYWSRPLTSSEAPVLPEGKAKIVVNGDNVTVTLSWAEQHFDGLTKNNCGDNTLGNDKACYQLGFAL